MEGAKMKGYRVQVMRPGVADTEMLHGGRVYTTKRGAGKAADRAGCIPVDFVPTGYTFPRLNDAKGWDDLRSYGYPARKDEGGTETS